MAIFTRGPSKAINSPRYLTLRHARQSAALHRAAQRDVTPGAAPPAPAGTDLKPGEEKLNAYWAPGLEAGESHQIVATQVVEAPAPAMSDKPLRLVSKQDFLVDAPQFSLPAGSVYSVYPPNGYPDDQRILPHVVLSDPHLPWERLGSPASEQDGNQDERSKVPWLALFTFTNDELRLAPGALVGTTFKHTDTLAVNMTVQELRAIPNVANPIPDATGPDVDAARGDFIFTKPELFRNLFSCFDQQNKRQDSGSPETTRYKYLAHVREINTTGMAVAGVEEVGIFSIVVGSRSGPLDNTAPVSVFVHLVSIEGVEDMKAFPAEGYVALCSLYSWTYTVMPPGMLNVHEAFDNIGKTLSVLRPAASITDPLSNGGDVKARIAARLRDGYSLVRYRTQTGEQTVALYRGPLTPTVVQPSDTVAKACSNSGQDLQILDREVGIMDISYSTAWTLGRTLALGNQAFAAALFRLRATIHARTMKALKISAVRSAGGPESYRSRSDVLRGLQDAVDKLSNLHAKASGDTSSQSFRAGPPQKRWYRPRLAANQMPSLHYNAGKIKDDYLEQATQIALDLAKATDGSVYDETNTPVSTDWMIVLAFVLDRMFLSGVPAHYLISDPTHLPAESLRFFFIDPGWLDAMVDGALSLANHSGEDRDRAAIKAAINAYLTHHPEHQPEYTPQIPRYGFYLRSDLVSMFPDLRVEVKSASTIGQAPLLRHEIVTDGVMMGLVDRQPGLPEFESLVFTQPPHQQRFAVGWKLTTLEVDIDVRKQYTTSVSSDKRDKDALQPGIVMKPTDLNNWFTWSTDAASGADDVRLLRLPYFAQQQLALLRAWSDDEVSEGQSRPFDDDTANSALLAMQLTDPVYSLTINLEGNQSTPAATAPLAVGATSTSPKQPFTLTSTAPSSITPLVKPGEAEERGSDDGTTATTATTTRVKPNPLASQLLRHKDYKVEPHVQQANLSPQVRAIPPYSPRQPSSPSPTTPALEDPGGTFDPANPPKYNCMVYSLANEDNQVETSGDNRQQDVVFSIHVENNQDSDYELLELDVRVALGPADPNDHRLLANYDGPGPRMLGNLRFNVLPQMDRRAGIDYLVLRLLPRSVTKLIGISTVQDMSFLLSLAQVNKFTRSSPREGETTILTLQTEAMYRVHPHDMTLSDSFDVVLRNADVEAQAAS
ncbi:uncharacterized protein MAM_03328 [Metarhizium album ARSEF 1941]|uniref:Uncharacterized protein n=1 Tax=Metarhizium album (strain ARSEF 1941) TaxID=1081103 RepID=A0A0B2WS11_METAS|nr:uncharacterized protein MAM_03328 [Metarhizium album ARSEF 1941]KHN98866.1 hypothetical protein MAM_03328 [Metarhizium album ARSEF 1941]